MMNSSMPQGRTNVTEFQQRVYEAVRNIPRGRISTYARIAAQINCGSARAIGQALRHNPFAPVVPCHRVVATDLTLGGFNGHSSGSELLRKRRLLESEGITFESSGKISDRFLQ